MNGVRPSDVSNRILSELVEDEAKALLRIGAGYYHALRTLWAMDQRTVAVDDASEVSRDMMWGGSRATADEEDVRETAAELIESFRAWQRAFREPSWQWRGRAYRGLKVPDARVFARFGAGQIVDEGWLVSASATRAIAQRFASRRGGDARVLVVIEDAVGVPIESHGINGRDTSLDEIILKRGRYRILEAEQNGNVLTVHAHHEPEGRA